MLHATIIQISGTDYIKYVFENFSPTLAFDAPIELDSSWSKAAAEI